MGIVRLRSQWVWVKGVGIVSRCSAWVWVKWIGIEMWL